MGKLWFLFFATIGFASIILFDIMVAIKTSEKFFRFGAIVLGLRKGRSTKEKLEDIDLNYDAADGSRASSSSNSDHQE